MISSLLTGFDTLGFSTTVVVDVAAESTVLDEASEDKLEEVAAGTLAVDGARVAGEGVVPGTLAGGAN